MAKAIPLEASASKDIAADATADARTVTVDIPLPGSAHAVIHRIVLDTTATVDGAQVTNYAGPIRFYDGHDKLQLVAISPSATSEGDYLTPPILRTRQLLVEWPPSPVARIARVKIWGEFR